MSVSVNAILVFGISLTEAEASRLPWRQDAEDDDDIERWIARQAGLREPDMKDYSHPEWKEHWKQKREAVAAYLLDEVRHSSSEYPMYILGLRGMELRVDWGEPKAVDMRMLDAAAGKCATFKAFCEEWNISYREPQWWLASYMS